MMRVSMMLGCAISLAAVLSVAATSAGAQQSGGSRGGDVVPCSLDGVNPADHPAIFNNPEVARNQYGFVRGPGGEWMVMPNCRVGDFRN